MSPNAAQIKLVTGTHLDGYNNDDIEGIDVHEGEIQYFPRGLNKIFKNLKGIKVVYTGLKEIHQSDLKHFPNLKTLDLSQNDLEILERNLFEFNPNLEEIYLFINKISHIDPNVFDQLTKLSILYLNSNTCINTFPSNNSSEVQNIVEKAKAKCTNLDYSNLEQSVKNLEAESSALSLEQLKEKLEKLGNEVKNSKFRNYFRDQIDELKAVQAKKAQEEAKTTTTITELTDLAGLLTSLRIRTDKLEKAMKELKEQNVNFDEKLAKIMKALNINE
ncbi:uncharacterized protein [Chironomus tepperi]|uniref:uncharacterized protein n=1 Tax=Chironomus tepperi TaxID=113505 RepID=UPI00391F0279